MAKKVNGKVTAEKITRVFVGFVGTNSAMLVMGDPCDFDHEWIKHDSKSTLTKDTRQFGYDACWAAGRRQEFAQLNDKGGQECGVVVETHADGLFPVYAVLRSDGQVGWLEVVINNFPARGYTKAQIDEAHRGAGFTPEGKEDNDDLPN